MFDDYTLVSESTEANLYSKVKALMAQGWQPLGGVSTSERTDRNGCRFVQAMGKETYAKAQFHKDLIEGSLSKLEVRSLAKTVLTPPDDSAKVAK